MRAAGSFDAFLNKQISLVLLMQVSVSAKHPATLYSYLLVQAQDDESHACL